MKKRKQEDGRTGNLAWYIGALALVVALIWAIIYSFGMSERVECIKWQSQANVYPAYYITQWQADQCNANGIDIQAPIR